MANARRFHICSGMTRADLLLRARKLVDAIAVLRGCIDAMPCERDELAAPALPDELLDGQFRINSRMSKGDLLSVVLMLFDVADALRACIDSVGCDIEKPVFERDWVDEVIDRL